jgi:hypothetical protein
LFGKLTIFHDRAGTLAHVSDRLATALIVQSVAPLTEVQRGELLPNIVRVMLTAFLEEQAR